MTQDTDTLTRDVEAAKAAYAAAEHGVVAQLSGTFTDADADDAAAQVLELAEEYGADHAAALLVADPERFGQCQPDAQARLTPEPIAAAIDALLTARDQLDQATRHRNAGVRLTQPDAMQVLTFGGREYVVDTRRGELRSVDNPTERYLLADRPDQPELAPSLSPTLAAEHGRDVPLAQPRPSTDRKPDRGR